MGHLTSSIRISSNHFYIPSHKDLPLVDNKLDAWYGNLLQEIACIRYSDYDLELLKDSHNYYGKYFGPRNRNFFLNHFGRNLAVSINYLFGSGKPSPRVLEIGSGCGNQLLLMAFLGAKTVGCDIRQDVCDLVWRRKEFYEKLSVRKLNISIICEDVFKVDWNSFGMFDGINFLFSFSNLIPNEKIIELVDRLLNPGGRIVFQEMNPMNYYNRIFRKRDSMPPLQVAEALKKHGFRIHSLRGGYALPPIFWRFFSKSILLPIDQMLCKSLFMSLSYHLMAEKI